MLSLKGFLLFVIISTGFVVPVCVGRTDKVLSGRELLTVMRKIKAGFAHNLTIGLNRAVNRRVFVE
jgi:hypothetical protein